MFTLEAWQGHLSILAIHEYLLNFGILDFILNPNKLPGHYLQIHSSVHAQLYSFNQHRLIRFGLAWGPDTIDKEQG
jgi:hypothetical protein